MFFKGSRYKNLAELTIIDADGKTSRSCILRTLPDTPGTFLHTVNQSDRLDLLAYKYYGEPRKWWLISDANPGFALPTDLLNRNPLRQEILYLDYPPEGNNWGILITTLKTKRGIVNAQADVFMLTLEITYNVQEIRPTEIIDVIKAQGLTVTTVSKKERIGQKIIIPPDQLM